MGALQAREMADAVARDEITERQALVWHLRCNCFPPVPMVMVDVALEAIDKIVHGDEHEDIDLPEGVTFRGGTKVMPWEAAEAFHLEGFLPVWDDDESPF